MFKNTNLLVIIKKISCYKFTPFWNKFVFSQHKFAVKVTNLFSQDLLWDVQNSPIWCRCDCSWIAVIFVVTVLELLQFLLSDYYNFCGDCSRTTKLQFLLWWSRTTTTLSSWLLVNDCNFYCDCSRTATIFCCDDSLSCCNFRRECDSSLWVLDSELL